MSSRRVTALIILVAMVLAMGKGVAAQEESLYRLGEIEVRILVSGSSPVDDVGSVIRLLERFRAVFGDPPASAIRIEVNPGVQTPVNIEVELPAGPVEGPGQPAPDGSIPLPPAEGKPENPEPSDSARGRQPGEPPIPSNSAQPEFRTSSPSGVTTIPASGPGSSSGEPGPSASTPGTSRGLVSIPLPVLHITARDLTSLAEALWQVWLPRPADGWLESSVLSSYVRREMLLGAEILGAAEYRRAIDDDWNGYRSYLRPKVADFPLLTIPGKAPAQVAMAKGRLFSRLLDLRIQAYSGGARNLLDVVRTGAATGQGWTLRGALEQASQEWNVPLITLYVRFAERGEPIRADDLWETAVFVDGQRLAIDVAPRIIRGRTLVPIRAVFEALGAEVTWDASTSRVFAATGGRTVTLTVGSLIAGVDDKRYLLDVAPIISNGRVLVPLRFSGEAFGAEVAWEAETLKILLSSGMGAPVSFPEFTGNSPVVGRLQGSGDDQPAVYLTFDDGPTRKVTPLVLDILARYNVKATFFVIGARARDLPELTRRIVREGHALGNHTWNHDYSDIYRSPEAFLASVRRAEAALYEIAGVRPAIVRAPGGTHGHFTPEYFAIMKQNGYAVINWNVSSADTTLPVPPADVIASNVIGNSKPKPVRKNTIVLLHDGAGHESSAEALPTIIEYFLSLGYRFDVLTPENPLAK